MILMNFLMFLLIYIMHYGFVRAGLPTTTPLPPDKQNTNTDIDRGIIHDPYQKSAYAHVVGVVAYFVTDTEFFNDLHTCVGTIVSTIVIVTAARCLYLNDLDASPEYLDIHTGIYYFINYSDSRTFGQMIRLHNPKHWRVHPHYDAYSRVHDIAVIYMPENLRFDEDTYNCTMVFDDIRYLKDQYKFQCLTSLGWNVNPLFIDSTVYMGATQPLRGINMFLEDCDTKVKPYYDYKKLWAGSPDGKHFVYCTRDYIYQDYVFWRGAALIFKDEGNNPKFTGIMTDFTFNKQEGKYYVIVTSLQNYETFIKNIHSVAHEEGEGAIVQMGMEGAHLPSPSSFLLPFSLMLLFAFKFTFF